MAIDWIRRICASCFFGNCHKCSDETCGCSHKDAGSWEQRQMEAKSGGRDGSGT